MTKVLSLAKFTLNDEVYKKTLSNMMRSLIFYVKKIEDKSDSFVLISEKTDKIRRKKWLKHIYLHQNQ